jgi:hypothetical protein
MLEVIIIFMDFLIIEFIWGNQRKKSIRWEKEKFTRKILKERDGSIFDRNDTMCKCLETMQ